MPDRQALEQRVIDAVLDLFEHMGSTALTLEIPNTTPPVYIVAGEPAKVRAVLALKEQTG